MRALNRIFAVVLVALAIVGVARLRIDVDILNLLPRDSEAARGIAEYQKEFLQSGELIAWVRSPSAAETSKAAEAIAEAARGRNDLFQAVFWKPPARESLKDAAQFLAYLWLNSPTGAVCELAASLAPEELPALLEETKVRIATSFSPADLFLLPRDPLNLSRVAAQSGESMEAPEKFFSSADGLERLVYLYSSVPLDNYEQCHAWLEKVRALSAGALSTAGVSNAKVSFTGRPVFVDEISAGMKNDMSTAAPGTLFMVGLLFYLLHREWKSLVFLLLTLALVMVWTACVGSAFLGSLNVVSLGFASILLGLAEDFGIILHQELKSHPTATVGELRKLGGPGVFWSALTTAAAFGLLNLSSLPGLKDLGTLIAIGILLGGWCMVFIFLPLICRHARPRPEGSAAVHRKNSAAGGSSMKVVMGISAVLLLAAVGILVARPPGFDPSPDVLRPRISEASQALKGVQTIIGTTGDPNWLLVHGQTEAEVRRKLETLDRHLKEAGARAGIEHYNLPLSVWPDPDAQIANLPLLKNLSAQSNRLEAAILAEGFTSEALQVASEVFAEWGSYTAGEIHWPRGRVAEWVLPKFVSPRPGNFTALALIQPSKSFRPEEVVPPELKGGVILSGWSLLGRSVLERVKSEVPLIAAGVGITVFVALCLTFRRIGPVLLSFFCMGFSGLVMLAIMGMAGWRWNLINLTALPLLLGMGVDYSIHILTALDRHGGRAGETFHSVGKALLLAGSTTIIGFVFLGFSSNSGMASLGKVCSLGLAVLLVNSVFLLPGWAAALRRKRA